MMPPLAAGPVEEEFRMSVRKQHTAEMGEKTWQNNFCQLVQDFFYQMNLP